MSVQASATGSSTAAEFVEFFAEGWGIGAGERFFEHFGSRLHPDAVMTQPLAPPTRGHAEFRRSSRRSSRRSRTCAARYAAGARPKRASWSS
jgi:hypothetical protein